MKRILLLAAAAAGAVVVGQRINAQRAEADLWAQLTDEAPAASPEPDPRPTPGQG
ncbi:DLW-39 family protein [Piscicoccus intestinalis]|uniref:DLW-39 family protein n=1 Tax=Piscicoccus intestinalis TaxID=746033 RepID=UPI001470441C|nr:DLW-39 family protein [Piscicoccus intestinalis]